MAHFYGGIKGQRGKATRLGSKDSGLHVWGQGWNFGVEVFLAHGDTDGASVYLTPGSNGAGQKLLLGVFTQADLAGRRRKT